MFTINQTINNATSLYEVKEITIARCGSEQWNQAFELADSLGSETPDTIEHIPASYEDPEMTKQIGNEHHLCVDRLGVNRADCIAVICSHLPSAAFPGIPAAGGVGYQFLYKGDLFSASREDECDRHTFRSVGYEYLSPESVNFQFS